LGYLTNTTSSISNVSKLTIHYYTFTPSTFYPILIAERGDNLPLVLANNSLTNVPSAATNLVRITLTGGTNNGSDNIPRFLVGETFDKRVVIWSNGYGGGPGNANLGSIPLLGNIKSFKLVGSNGTAPVACALLEDNSMRTWGGRTVQIDGRQYMPPGATNILSFMTIDPNFDSSDGKCLVIANGVGGKIYSWWATGEYPSSMGGGMPGMGGTGGNWQNFPDALNSLSGVKIIPYDQENLSSPEGRYFPFSFGMPSAHWPVLAVPADGGLGPIRLLSHYHVVGSTFNSTYVTPESFRLENIEAVYPIGSSRSSVDGAGSGTYGWTLALRLKDGTLNLQYVTDATSSASTWNRTATYFASPNSKVLNVFSAKGAGISTGGQNTGAYFDNLVIIAEPSLISP